MSDELKPCPFCGGEVLIGISDDEGNKRDEEYLCDPWSGVSFHLVHEAVNNKDCPIATHEEEILGSLLYEDKEEITKAWNTRATLPVTREKLEGMKILENTQPYDSDDWYIYGWNAAIDEILGNK